MSKFYDQVMNQVVEQHFDHSNGILYTKRSEDVEPLLDELAEERNSGRNGFSVGRNYRKIGSIPLIEVERVLREKGINLMANTKEAHAEVKKYLAEHKKFMSVDKL